MIRRVYRHRLSPTISDMLSDFALLHAYEERNDYNKSWEEWLSNNRGPVHDEGKRLGADGFTGDHVDKMYKAARYYFRKKSTTKPAAPKTRRLYVGTSREVLEAMDQSIRESLRSSSPRSPAATYSLFESDPVTSGVVIREVARLTETAGAGLSEAEAKDKLKKTFKNRYYKIVSKLDCDVPRCSL